MIQTGKVNWMEYGNIQDLKQGNIDIEIIKIVFRRCTPEWVMAPGRIEHANLTFVVSGEADYLLGGKSYRVKQGSLICVPYNSLRQANLVLNNPMRCYSIDFFIRDRQGTLVDLPLPYVSDIEDTATMNDLCSRLNISWLRKSEYGILRTKALLQLIFYQVVSENDRAEKNNAFADDRIRSMMTYIGRHYANALSLSFFAERMNLNKVYLGMRFKEVAGITFHQYLLSARLNAAEDLLCTGRYTINEVAYMTGFQDPSYFSRSFMQVYGVRPGHYKRIEKPEEPDPASPVNGQSKDKS